MDRPDLPLNALRVFEVAMRQGSFTRAAIELRVTQAAVSHQVSRLEDLLGTVLFLRTSQGLVPTDEGKLLFPVLGRGFDAMASALDQLGGRRDIDVLNIGVNTTFALGWLMPRIALFRNETPRLTCASRRTTTAWKSCARDLTWRPVLAPGAGRGMRQSL